MTHERIVMAARFTRSRTGIIVTGASAVLLLSSVGGAVAANKVGSPEIVNGGVKKADIASNAVGSKEVKNHSLRGRDLNPKLVNRLRVAALPASRASPARTAVTASTVSTASTGPTV